MRWSLSIIRETSHKEKLRSRGASYFSGTLWDCDFFFVIGLFLSPLRTIKWRGDLPHILFKGQCYLTRIYGLNIPRESDEYRFCLRFSVFLCGLHETLELRGFATLFHHFSTLRISILSISESPIVRIWKSWDLEVRQLEDLWVPSRRLRVRGFSSLKIWEFGSLRVKICKMKIEVLGIWEFEKWRAESLRVQKLRI